MSTQLKTYIMQTLVFVALILTGLGVQASQVVPAERTQLQEHGMNANSAMGSDCATMIASAAEADGDSSDRGCEMDPVDCHSVCATYLAVISASLPVLARAVAAEPVAFDAGAAIAAQYPIDHPPKLLSSL